jgi:hypothetical protein
MEYDLLSRAPKAMALAGLILAAVWAAPGAAAASGDPFEALKGDWKGGGTVWPSDGQPKKVDCSVKYAVAGGKITQTLRCTGDDYEVDTTLKLTDKGDKIKGSWNESVYDASGTVTGTAKDDTIHALIAGDKFSGRMSIKVADARHTINIVQFNAKSGVYRLATSLTLER